MSEPGPDDVADLYERQARAWDTWRASSGIEVPWLARFVDALPERGRVLDLGCGSGRPVAAWLAGQGLRVTGIDIAPAMIALARAREAEGDWRVGDMRTLNLPDRFAGIVGWDSVFHLDPEAQRALLPRLAAHLVPGGALLLTVGPRAGEVMGHVGPEPVYHASLSPAEYFARLEACGLRVAAFLAEDPDCGGRTVVLAIKNMTNEESSCPS